MTPRARFFRALLVALCASVALYETRGLRMGLALALCLLAFAGAALVGTALGVWSYGRTRWPWWRSEIPVARREPQGYSHRHP